MKEPGRPAMPQKGTHVLPAAQWRAVLESLHLSDREAEILMQVFDDQKEQAIAFNLGISPHTVHTHFERMYRKLGVRDRTGLALRVFRAFLELQSTSPHVRLKRDGVSAEVGRRVAPQPTPTSRTQPGSSRSTIQGSVNATTGSVSERATRQSGAEATISHAFTRTPAPRRSDRLDCPSAARTTLAACCSLFASAAYLLTSYPVIADEIVVPDQFVTIQAAVDYAEAGDRVLVRPGTYVENVRILGKAIELVSFGGPDVTVIDGSAPSHPDTLSVITAIGAGELRLAGFTLRHAFGGIDFGSETGADSGGGLAYLATGGTITDCVIEDNVCGGNGGGMHLVVSLPAVTRCLVRDNVCSGDGGGIHIFLGSPTIHECTIENNHAAGDGGGLCVSRGSPEIVDCAVSGNRALRGAGITTQESSNPAIVRTVISGNAAGDSGLGGGLFLRDGSPRIESCTIVGNQGPIGSGIMALFVSGAFFTSIVAFNEGGSGIACRQSASQVACCDLFGNAGGDELCGVDGGGNFSLDPLLCSDLSIAATSPCTPENSPAGCGLIGALTVGCTQAIEPVTWGGIKTRYRDSSSRPSR